MKILIDLNDDETNKLWHITQSASQKLNKDYDIATLCLNIIRLYLQEHSIQYIPDEGGKG